MKFSRKLLAGIAAGALAASPALAQQTSRASAPTEEASDLAAGSAWIGIIGVVLVVALAVIAASRDDTPASP